MTKLLNLPVLALLLLILPLAAIAQKGTGTLQGSVADPSGRVLPAVAVTAHNEETGVDRSTVTDSTGHYRIPALDSGVYTVRVESSGFSSEERKGVKLTVGRELALDFTMKVGSDSTRTVYTPLSKAGMR